MRSMIRYCLMVFGLILTVPAFASPDRPADCSPTPAIRTSNYPGFAAIATNNKLARPAGKAIYAEGLPVQLIARVFDRNCVPLQNAKIELWHADPSGRHRFATKAALATPDAVFAGGGRTTSNNMGQFQFFSIYPGGYRYTVKRDDGSRYSIKRAPHFNLSVHHEGFKTFRTNLFFDGEPENPSDHRLKRLKDSRKPRVIMHTQPAGADVNAGLIATIDIILPDRDPFRKY